MEEEKSIEELREEFENTAVEDDKNLEASLSKEERSALENSIVILGPRDQEEEDKEIHQGVLLWFQNKSLEAEKIFLQKPNDPLSVTCLGATLFLKAMMTFAEPDIAKANTVLGRTKMLTTVYASVYKNKTQPASGGLFSKLFSFGQHHEISNGEMRAAVIKAECGLLMGMMQLLQESMVGYVKAGWSLRRGYKDVSWCYQQLQHSNSSAAPSPITSPVTSPITSPFISPSSSPPSSPHQSRKLDPAPHHAFDKHTLGGVQFAFGCINVVLASLPAKVLKMVSFFGFSCDRELGFDLLKKSLQGGGIRAPLASLFLLSFYVHLPSFVPILLPKYLPLAKEVLAISLQMFPGSALHLWLAGRTQRLSRNLKESNASFLQSISVLDSNASDIPQLKDLCYYDLGLNHLWLLEWDKAGSYFEKLAQNNYWSKAFYVFSQAICTYMQGNKEQAVTLFETVPSLVVRKYGGRTLGVEQYVLRKVKMYSDLGYELGSLALEIIYIWNGFYCMPLPLLEKCLKMVNEDLAKWEKRNAEANKQDDEEDDSDEDEDESDEEDPNPYQDDIKSLLLLIKAVILQNLGEKHYEESMTALQLVINECSADEDTFIHPFAWYELGMLHFLNHQLEEAKDAFRKAREFSKYNFEYRLNFRLHMALSELSREKEEEKERERELMEASVGEEQVEEEKEDGGKKGKKKKGRKARKKEKKKKEKKNKGK